jgi:hypothetical protein
MLLLFRKLVLPVLSVDALLSKIGIAFAIPMEPDWVVLRSTTILRCPLRNVSDVKNIQYGTMKK